MPCKIISLALFILLLSPVLRAQAPTDEELKALEQQIEQQETEQAEAKKRAEAEANKKAEEERLRTEENVRRKTEEEARAQAEADAQRKDQEDNQRLQDEQQRKKFDKYMADADAAMNNKDFASAMQVYTQALEIFPDDAAALAGHTRAGESQKVCSAIAGEWYWGLGSTTIVNVDGTMQNISLFANKGTWECTDPAQRRFTLRWESWGWVDDLILSNDGAQLDGKSSTGILLRFHRKK